MADVQNPADGAATLGEGGVAPAGSGNSQRGASQRGASQRGASQKGASQRGGGASPPADGGAPPAAPGGGFSSGGGGGNDPIQLGNQYSQELQSALENLRQKGNGYAEYAQSLISSGSSSFESTKDEAISTLQQFDGDVSTPQSTVVQTFMWSAVLTLGASLGYFAGSNFLGGLVNALAGGFTLALASFIGLPLYAYYNVGNQGSDVDSRIFLLGIFSGAGVLLGAALNETYYYAEPLAFLTPLAVALAFSYGAPSLGTSRTTLLGAAVGGGFAVQLAVGILTGSLSGPYFFLAALYAFGAFVTLQYLFKNVTSEAPTHVYMLGYATVYLYAKGLSYYLMGSPNPPLRE